MLTLTQKQKRAQQPAGNHHRQSPETNHGPFVGRINAQMVASALRQSTAKGDNRSSQQSDKSTGQSKEKQDQSASVASQGASKKGIDIKVEQVGTYTSEEFPDGFRWIQTVTTNDPGYTAVGAPLLATPVTYVDPTPNDDAKPFYWTDAEFQSKGPSFEDHPGRPAHSKGTINWDAILTLNGVNGKSAECFDSLTYGFSIATDGTVTVRHAGSPASLAQHTSTLKSTFPGWTFT